jgi:hypothetical protein
MRLWVGLLVLALVGIAGYGAYLLAPRDSATKASVSDAVLRFRHEIRGGPRHGNRAESSAPPYGVYRYRTSGNELIEANVLTAGHAYGGISTITVTPINCGLNARWQVLVERWSEESVCFSADGSEITKVRDYHEFFEEQRLTSFKCQGTEVPSTPKLRPGMRWSTRCKARGAAATQAVHVTGLGWISVDGKQVEVVHLVANAVLTGNPEGNAHSESWIRRSDGLLVRRISKTTGHDSVENGDFNESYEMRLISTRPQR